MSSIAVVRDSDDVGHHFLGQNNWVLNKKQSVMKVLKAERY